MRALLVLVSLAAAASTTHAHSLTYGVLRVVETDAGARFSLRAGGREGVPPVLSVRARGGCSLRRVARAFDEGLLVLSGTLACPERLDGAELAVEGLDGDLTISVRVERLDGAVQSALIDAGAPAITFDRTPSPLSVLARYLELGAAHIAGGIDHLLFVLALVLVAFDPRAKGAPVRTIVSTITGFTIGHSATLSLAALGALALPPEPVEIVIALSIVLLAAELARPHGSASLTFRRPWLVASTFGLLHGLGFAGALAELGLPPGHRALALLGFNAGVELGQLAFVAGVLLVLAGGRRFVTAALASRLAKLASYTIGAIGAVWLAERAHAWL